MPKLGNLTEGEKYEKQPEKAVFSLPQSKIGSEEPIFASPLVRGGLEWLRRKF